MIIDDNKLLIKVFCPLLLNNKILLKALTILFLSYATDYLFIPENHQILMKLKGLPGWKKHSQLLFEENNQSSELLGYIPPKDFNKLLNLIKLSNQINIIENNKPYSGSFKIQIQDIIYFVRFSIHPTNFGESLALRILKKQYFIDPVIPNFLKNGLNIIAGITGSGKTSILYGILSNLKYHVITLEDPAEFMLPNACQTDVSIIGYREAIKSILRQSPDIIVVGEIRDIDSCFAATHSALTGHKVLCTIHAGSLQDIVLRFREFECNF